MTTTGYVRRYFLILALLQLFNLNVESQFLKRALDSLPEVMMEMSTPSVHIRPVFGAGDANSGIIRGISRYYNLAVDPGGRSKKIKYPDEEHVLYILCGNVILLCGKEKVPLNENDFVYIPAGLKYGFFNPHEKSFSVIVMGFKLMAGICRDKPSRLMIANTDDVDFRLLPSHGPTTQFQLLMGTTESTRDKLAAACQVNSLFIMDFAAGGTNNPHRHNDEEEIYLILKGHGDIVAGEDEGGLEIRHPSVEGDIFFFSPKTLIGFYSGNTPEEEHARILAVRFKCPLN